MKRLTLLFVLTCIFSFLIFLVKSYFFWWMDNIENKIIEEKYIEPVPIIETNFLEEKKVIEKFQSAKDFSFIFIPSSFKNNQEALIYQENLLSFIDSKYLNSITDSIKVLLYEEKFEVRWRMKNKQVKLYWILNMPQAEFISVWIHEFAHFIDLYFLKKIITIDLSDIFYNVSWESVKVLKAWAEQKDFVSGYAITNQYEDFAESFTYYVLHNDDFLEKTKNSSLLKQKYDFFWKYLFRENEFKTDAFSNKEIVKDYYRDITKIWYSLDNFLEYLD